MKEGKKNMEFNIANAGKFYFDDIYTPPFQIISYSNFLGESSLTKIIERIIKIWYTIKI